jgi:uncharacterized membrane protein YphA (DoxX/SURF4 family)
VRQRSASFWYPLLGLGFVITGTDKLFGMRAYRRMFRELGWSERDMRLIGTAELAGGTLLVAGATRLLGGALLAGASVAVLGSELRHRNANRALARLAVLAGVVTAVWPVRSAR